LDRVFYFDLSENRPTRFVVLNPVLRPVDRYQDQFIGVIREAADHIATPHHCGRE